MLDGGVVVVVVVALVVVGGWVFSFSDHDDPEGTTRHQQQQPDDSRLQFQIDIIHILVVNRNVLPAVVSYELDWHVDAVHRQDAATTL